MSISLVSSLLRHQRLAVFTHIRPDGDALGSQVGCCLWLQQHGVTPIAFNEDPSPYNLEWLQGYFPVQKPSKDLIDSCDGILFLDGNHPDRFGKMAEYAATLGKPLYLIDHHPSPVDIYADRHWSTSTSSTAQLVYELYLESGIDHISREAAIALYTGMVTDTGSFRFDSVSPSTHMAVADLLTRGNFKPNIVHEQLYDQRSPAQFALLGMALGTMQFFAGGRIGIICVTQEMFQKTGTVYGDTEAFVSYPMSTKGVEAAVIFIEYEGRIKLSFRSKSTLDVNLWARQFEGGGHAKAAGGWTDAPLHEAIDRVLKVGLSAL